MSAGHEPFAVEHRGHNTPSEQVEGRQRGRETERERSKDTDDNRSFVNTARRAQIVEAALETVADVGYANAIHILAELLTRFQAAGDFRADFDPNSMAIAIRAVIDAAPGRLADPAFDIDQYAREAVTVFHRATCVTGA
ncbi:MAG: hypothetical protein ABSG43_26655 [Solirubrobacteraceae bacterium]|jgi:hypothetical protein